MAAFPAKERTTAVFRRIGGVELSREAHARVKHHWERDASWRRERKDEEGLAHSGAGPAAAVSVTVDSPTLGVQGLEEGTEGGRFIHNRDCQTTLSALLSVGSSGVGGGGGGGGGG